MAEPSLRERWAVALTLSCTGLFMLIGASQDSLTTDEGLYLPTGYVHWTEQNGRLGYEHPPLVRDWAALPLLLLNLQPSENFLPNQYDGQVNDTVFTFGDRWVYGQTEPPETLLLFARAMMVLLTLGFGYALYAWTRTQFGPDAGVYALLLYLSSPYVLAHGRLVTTDLATGLAAWVTVLGFHAFLKTPTRGAALRSGISLGAALLIKFSLVLLLPFLVSLVLWQAFSESGLREPGAALRRKQRQILVRGLGQLAVTVLIALILVWTYYWLLVWNYPPAQQARDASANFAPFLRTSPAALGWIQELAQISVLRPLALFFSGMAWQLTRGGAFNYYWGEGSYTSWPSFYLFGFFFKHPLGFLALCGWALWEMRHRMRSLSYRFHRPASELTALWGWVVWSGFVLSFINVANTGTRYLLLLLPCVYIGVAVGLSKISADKRPWIFTLLGLSFVSVYAQFPHHLSYFNELLGQRRGAYYLVDTDADWSQDWVRLGRWINSPHAPSIDKISVISSCAIDPPRGPRVSAYSRAAAAALGSRYQDAEISAIPRGYFVIPARLLYWCSASAREGEKGWSGDQSRSWIQRDPVAVIGGALYVFYQP